MGDEEIRIGIDFQDLKMLHRAIHHGAGIHTRQSIQEFKAALNGPLQQGARKFAGVVGHIIGCNV